MKTLKKKRGFTLIELLVVIAIIGTLATIVLVSLNTARSKARDTRRATDLKNIALALEMYYDANSGVYPVTASYSSLAPTYIPTIPTDPKTSANYTYAACGGTGLNNNYALKAQLENNNTTILNNSVTTVTCTAVGSCAKDCGDTDTGTWCYCIQP